jgi:hypothetical protein
MTERRMKVSNNGETTAKGEVEGKNEKRQWSMNK